MEGTSDTAGKAPANPGTPRKKKTAPRDDGHIGNALRSVYQRTVSEDIPLEMLDLLKKLD